MVAVFAPLPAVLYPIAISFDTVAPDTFALLPIITFCEPVVNVAADVSPKTTLESPPLAMLLPADFPKIVLLAPESLFDKLTLELASNFITVELFILNTVSVSVVHLIAQCPSSSWNPTAAVSAYT